MQKKLFGIGWAGTDIGKLDIFGSSFRKYLYFGRYLDFTNLLISAKTRVSVWF